MEFELLEWGNGKVVLCHEDSLRGEDIIIELIGEKAFRLFYERGRNQKEEINLISFLRNLVQNNCL